MILTFSTETLIQTNVPSYKQSDVLNSQTVLIQIFRKTWNTVFSRLNAGGVYLNSASQTRRLFEPGVYSNPAFIRGPAFIY